MADTSTDEADVEMIKLQIMDSSAPKSVTFFVQEAHNYLVISNYLEVVDGAETTLTDSSIYWWATGEYIICTLCFIIKEYVNLISQTSIDLLLTVLI